MAFYDNKLWLLSHIHNSFISSDDTGVCEMVMGGGNFKEELEVVARGQGLTSYLPSILAGEEEEEMRGRGSPDIKAGPGRRERANTALQLQQKLASKEKDPVGKSVTWKPGTGNLDCNEELFPKKEVIVPNGTITSLLAIQLEEQKEEDRNPWQEFARWEGAHFPESQVRKVEVFPVLGDDQLTVPLNMSCSKDAKVRDIVGLVCWRYTLEGRQPHLESNLGPDAFDLFMCEEDGTVDRDFPCLDWRETFSKYGFQQLALVPRKEEVIGQHRVTLHLPDGSFTELSVDRTLTLGELLEQGLQKRRRTLPSLGHSQVPLRYHLEAAESSGVALDPATNLSSHLGSEFYIVRSNSKRPSGPRETSGGEHLNIYEVHLFQSFDVQMITKVRTKVDIHLGISGEKVEIDPKPQASWTVYKQKAATYDMDQVVSCEVVGRGEDRLTVRLVHLAESGWRWVEFEGCRNAVEAVVDKVNHLLEMRQTPARKQRKDYLENKKKKSSKI